MTTIFLHIPKTAGTTVRQHLVASVPQSEVRLVYAGERGFTQPGEMLRMPTADVDKLQFVYGHINHQQAASIACSAPRFATMLRNPVTRAISLYRHFMLIHHKRTDLGLRAAIDERLTGQLFNNQTAIVSGISSPPTECNREILGVAEHTLASKYSYIGFTESMALDKDAELARLGLAPGRHPDVNITRDAKALPEITWDDICAARECNQLDMRLYRFALDARARQEKHGPKPLPAPQIAALMHRNAQADTPTGWFDGIDDGVAKGWAVTQCATVPETVLFVRNHAGAVRYQLATQAKPEPLAVHASKVTRCAFSVDLRALLQAAAKGDRVHCYAMSTMQELPNSPVTI